MTATPAGAGAIPCNKKVPNLLLSVVLGFSPSKTCKEQFCRVKQKGDKSHEKKRS